MTTACAIVLSPGHVYPDHEEAPSRFMYLGGWEAKPYARLTPLHKTPTRPTRIRDRRPLGTDAAGIRSRLPAGTGDHRLCANLRHPKHLCGCLPGSGSDAGLHARRAGRRGTKCLCHRPPAGTPCRAGSRDGLLPAEQYSDRGNSRRYPRASGKC